MTERYEAIISNDYYNYHKKYWKVKVETNDINTLNNICSALNLIKQKEKER